MTSSTAKWNTHTYSLIIIFGPDILRYIYILCYRTKIFETTESHLNLLNYLSQNTNANEAKNK